MERSYCCIVACTHLGNGTGRRTETMAAPLQLTSGPVGYEAVLQLRDKIPVARGLVLTCDSVHLWRLYSAASLGHQLLTTIAEACHVQHFNGFTNINNIFKLTA